MWLSEASVLNSKRGNEFERAVVDATRAFRTSSTPSHTVPNLSFIWYLKPTSVDRRLVLVGTVDSQQSYFKNSTKNQIQIRQLTAQLSTNTSWIKPLQLSKVESGQGWKKLVIVGGNGELPLASMLHTAQQVAGKWVRQVGGWALWMSFIEWECDFESAHCQIRPTPHTNPVIGVNTAIDGIG